MSESRGSLKVELVDFDTLTDAEKLGSSNNGCGREWANYLRVSRNGETLLLENDAMEPEDCRFTRDLRWIKDVILMAYEIGRTESPAPQPADKSGVNDG